MSDEEFYRMYGRLPRRRKKKKKIYWGRIIIALIVLIGIIVGIVQLISFIAGKLRGDEPTVVITEESSGSENEKSGDEEPETVPDGNAISPKHTGVQLIVCIDPGHGGDDGGALDQSGNRYEKDDDLRLALRVRDYLTSCGVKVIMTRDDDTFVDLDERCKIANDASCDLFVSIHRNSADPEYSGIEVWVNKDEPAADILMAEKIVTVLAAAGVSDNRGVKYGCNGDPSQNYYINADTVMPSVLVEMGFITNDQDNRDFDEKCNAYGDGIGESLIQTAIELGVIDSDGSRILGTPLLSKEKYINNHGGVAQEGSNGYREDGTYDGDGSNFSNSGSDGWSEDYTDGGDNGWNEYGLEETEPSVTPSY